jgi:hypothetical protein
LINYFFFKSETDRISERILFPEQNLRTFMKLPDKMSIFVTDVKIDVDFKISYTNSTGQNILWVTFEESLFDKSDAFLSICIDYKIICKLVGLYKFPDVSIFKEDEKLNTHLNEVFKKLKNRIDNGDFYEHYLVNFTGEVYFFLQHALRLLL